MSNMSKLDSYCYMVSRGVKPASLIAIQERYIDEATSIIESYRLEIYVENVYSGWRNIWIYKHPHILSVIKSLPQVPNTVFEHWVLGKLFGYSEEAILEFVENEVEKQ